jgi:outer membrane biosynthesis protein TonB
MLTPEFEIVNKREKNKNRAVGVTITVVLHALLLLGLFFLVITTPDPPFQDNEGGMTVNYGTSDVGTGDQQAFTTVPVQVQQEEAAPAPPTPSSSAPEDLETQEAEDAPVIEKKTEVKKPKEKSNPDAEFKPKPKPAANPVPETPKPKVDKDALFTPGAVGKPNNSKGDGEGKGKGDQGDPNGDPNSRNYHGGGTGNGPPNGGNGLGDGNVRLTGRKLRSKPAVKNPCESARGKVVISIKVNRDGRVTNAAFTQSGSTTSDECLVNIAQQAAMKYLFDENSTAAETQTGSVVFIFKED